MRVVIASDSRFASREQSMLLRLQVGLADAGIRVIQALPQGVDFGSGNIAQDTVHFDQVGMPLSMRWRASRAAKAILGAGGAAAEAPEVVHVFGGSIWPFGAALADQLGAVLVLEAWRAGLTPAVQRLHGRPHGGASTVILAPDPGLARHLHEEAPNAVVKSARWGVHAPTELRAVLRPDRVWSVLIAGAGLDRRAYVAAFEAIADIARSRSDFLVFADAVAAQRAELWQLAARLGVRDRLSLVDEMDANRELVLRGDVLILPEARGEQRTLVLEAMGCGMPVVAAADPLNSSLIDGRSALLVPAGDRAAWGDTLSGLFADPDRVERLAASANAYVREEHRPSRQVREVIEAYEAALGKAPIPFPG